MKSVCFHNATIITGYTAMEDCSILIEEGRIADVFNEWRFAKKSFSPDTLIYDVEGAYIVPGFIDEHIHGLAGFGTDDRSAEAILEMSKSLSQYGVTAFCPTIYPQAAEDMKKTIRAVIEAMGHEQGARIMGIHMEGPFISPEKAGVQKPEFIKPVDMDLMEELYHAAKGHIVNMTVAPELKGMRELALYCVSKGITLQAGHTNATYENMLEGMQAGILHSTHMFNAMSSLHHRDPNAVGAVLIYPEMACEIIADGHHVHKDLVLLLLRDKPVSKIVLVTDALKPTEQRDCPLFANHEEVYLKDGVFLRKSDDVIAGSSLTMIRGVRNLAGYGIPLEQVIKMASSNPARILGFQKKGSLVPGYDADITIFDKQFNVLATLIGGEFKKNLF